MAFNAVFFMFRNRPVVQVRLGRCQKYAARLRSALLFPLSAGLLGALVLAAPAAKAQGAEQNGGVQAAAGSPEGTGGSAVCATCHADVVKDFAGNPHSRTHGGAGSTCESCHGDGKDHVEARGDKTKIWNPVNAQTRDGKALCLNCHKDRHQGFNESAHGRGDVNCLGCHDMHHSKADALLKEAQPQLCYECHGDERHDFSMPFHHQVNEGVVQCSDCHDPHGARARGETKAIGEENATCVKCHTESAGPWKHEHSAVKSEGCVACHTAHGGANKHMLKRADVSALCLECHAPASSPTAGAEVNTAHSFKPPRADCTSCHADVHGSNTSELFLRGPE